MTGFARVGNSLAFGWGGNGQGFREKNEELGFEFAC